MSDEYSHSFNDVTITFNDASIKTDLLSNDYDEKAAKIKATGAGASKHRYQVGIPDDTYSMVFVGTLSTFYVGATGVLSIAWPDGSTPQTDTVVVVSVKIKGGVDQDVQTTVELAPAYTGT